MLAALFVRPLAPSLRGAPEVAQRARAFAAYLELLESTGCGELREVQFKTIHYVHKALLKGWRHVLGSIRTHRKFPET